MSPLGAEVAFISGTARGIGAGTARALADRVRLIRIDQDAAALRQIADELGRATSACNVAMRDVTVTPE